MNLEHRIRFGGEEGTITVARKLFARSRRLEATLRIERMGLRVGFSFASREPTFQLPSNRCRPVSVERPREFEVSINWPGRSCHAAGKESEFPLRCHFE